MYKRLIRWAFTRFYREFSWTYDTVAALVSGGYWKTWTLSVIPYLHGRILEVGCGTGNLQQALTQHPAFPIAIGLDASAQMVKHARRKIERVGGVTRLMRGDARTLPFPARSFDTVVATFPSEYIAERNTLAEAWRVLSPGGRLVVALGAQFGDDGLYARLVDLAYRLTGQRSPLRDSTSATGVQPAPADAFLHQLKQTLTQTGFQVQDQWVAAPGGSVYIIIGEANRCPQQP
jgi:ubiquinone/menaquinone biosynthesis C-methylase UbiE